MKLITAAGCLIGTMLVSKLALAGLYETYLQLAHYTPISVSRDAKTHKVTNRWQGTKASFGFVDNTGNSTTETVNATGNLQYAITNWVFIANASFVRNTSEQGLSAQRFTLGGQIQYNISKKMYSFAQGGYVNDKFDGYTYVFNENIGLGRRLVKTDHVQVDVQAGPGAQHERLRSNGRRKNLFAFLGSVYFNWQITKDAAFTESVQSVWTRQNIHSESDLDFTSNIGGGFQTQLGFDVLSDSQPQPGSKKISTITTVSIVYTFA